MKHEGIQVKADSYKLKYIPTEEELKSYGFRDGGCWISEDAVVFKSALYTYKPTNLEFSVGISFGKDFSVWDDFNNVLVMDEAFCQPYTPFYGKNYKSDVGSFPMIEYCIEKYNEFMGQFPFIERVN